MAAYVQSLEGAGWRFITRWIKCSGCKGPIKEYELDRADPATAAALVVKAGIVAKEAIAEKAIPACNVVCIEGNDMKTALSGYLQVLYDADPSSVGGSLPGEDFYYLG